MEGIDSSILSGGQFIGRRVGGLFPKRHLLAKHRLMPAANELASGKNR
jgi:hypothetical protein